MITHDPASAGDPKNSTLPYNWVGGKNEDISELKGDTTLTNEQVQKVQMELDWESARNNRIAQDQTAALARVVEKIAKALQSTQNLEELKAIVAKTSKKQGLNPSAPQPTYERESGTFRRDVHHDQPPRNFSMRQNPASS